MAWDKDVPAGSTKVSASDELIRGNQAAIETAVDEEHAFATGGTQTGRHSFLIDTAANISGASPSLENGGIAFASDVRSGKNVLQVRDSGSMENADVEPLDGSSNPTLPRVNDRSKFTTCQFGEWETLSISSGAITIDLATSSHKTVTMTENITVNSPSNTISGYSTTVQLDLVQDGTGSRTVSFGSAYRSATQAVQVSTTAGARTLLTLKVMANGTVLVSSLADWNKTIT